MPMPIVIDNEEYFTIEEACAYLGGISRETLRRRTKEEGIPRYTRGVMRTVYYRKADIEKLNELRQLGEND